MKILAVKPMKGGSLPIIEHVIRAFHTMGNDVVSLDTSGFLPNSGSFEDLGAFYTAKKAISDLIVYMLKEWKPHMLFGIAQSPIFPPVLQYCRRLGIVRVYWFVEDYKVLTYWEKISRYYDFFFVIQKNHFLSLLKQRGIKAFYLPLAADPDIHRPLKLDPEDKKKYGSSISFVGAGYPNRISIFEKLHLRDFKIWGSPWNVDPFSPLNNNLQNKNKRVSVSEYVKIFNATDINLNIHSSIMPENIGNGDFVNPRTFEIAACRAFQIVDRRSLMAELFNEGEELVVCNNKEDLQEKIKTALNDPPYRRECAEKAYKRVLKEHTYMHRVKDILAVVRAAL